MFNQKINHFLSENPDYLNRSMGAPYFKARDIHNCGTTVLKYNKAQRCGSIPLQTWCSKNVAVESFAMRPIVNSKEYFENIKKYLSELIMNDSLDLLKSGLKSEKYRVIDSFATEPSNSFLQAIELNVTNRLIYLLGESSDKIDMFKNYNPLCEGFIINDIDIKTYQSTTNTNHYLHSIVFAAVNTTRYNTVSFKATIYQDSEPMMDKWNNVINRVETSRDVGLSESYNTPTNIYIGFIDLLNNTTCVVGQESECEFRGHNLTNLNGNSNIINQNDYAAPQELSWTNYPGLAENFYNESGNYDPNGNIRIVDTGPSNFDNLLSSFLN